MDFPTFHKYVELAESGVAPPLTCRLDGYEVVVVLGINDEPALRCFYCGALTQPGQNQFDEIAAVVKEYYD